MYLLTPQACRSLAEEGSLSGPDAQHSNSPIVRQTRCYGGDVLNTQSNNDTQNTLHRVSWSTKPSISCVHLFTLEKLLRCFLCTLTPQFGVTPAVQSDAIPNTVARQPVLAPTLLAPSQRCQVTLRTCKELCLRAPGTCQRRDSAPAQC